MDLRSGVRLGPYEIVSRIGVGGMGEVFAARDSRLNRRVAIKVLPSAVAADAKLKLRFEREAKAIAQLSHPNICTLHDVGQHDALTYLVMELIDGESLADRLERGPLPLPSVLRFGSEIAAALDCAHRGGIVHRDLKPKNIMITASGAKLVDFGLAKLRTPPMSVDSTISEEGAIVGTMKYMSPEQLDGKETDARTDIFALGAVLYEMATGNRAFEGSTPTSVIDAIINRQPPPIMASQPLAALDHVVSKCLEKSPDDRWQSAYDVAEQLKWIATLRGDAAAAASPQQRAWIAAAIVAAIGIGAASLLMMHGAAPPRAETLTQLTFGTGVQRNPTLAPDGKTFAFASEEFPHANIYLQRVGGQNAINLTKDSDAENLEPTFSPDGEQIAFWSLSPRRGGGIFLMGATGESVRHLTNFGFEPSWSPDGKKIAFGSEPAAMEPWARGAGALWIVEVDSGKTRRLTTTHNAIQPSWSPHGHRIAFWGVDKGARRNVFTIDPNAADPERTIVPVTDDASINWDPIWSPDGRSLYFGSDRDGTMNLWRAAIDEASGRVHGVAEPLHLPTKFAAHFTIDRAGDIAFASIARTTMIVRYDIDPQSLSIKGIPSVVYRGTRAISINGFAVSPDEKQFAITSPGKQQNLFVMNSDGSGTRQITTAAERDFAPSWSRDGQRIYYFASRSDGSNNIWSVRPDGTDMTQVTAGVTTGFPRLSPDGKNLLVTGGPAVVWDMQQHRGQALPRIDDVHVFGRASWSPDGQFAVGERWRTDGKPPATDGLAIYSFRTMTYESIVDDGQTMTAPIFSADGKSVIYGLNNQLVAVDLRTRVRHVMLPELADWSMFAVAPDGRTLYVESVQRQADVWLLTQR